MRLIKQLVVAHGLIMISCTIFTALYVHVKYTPAVFLKFILVAALQADKHMQVSQAYSVHCRHIFTCHYHNHGY